jgi:DNA polymerase
MNNKTILINGLRKAMEFYRELGFEYLPVKRADIGDILSGVPSGNEPVSSEVYVKKEEQQHEEYAAGENESLKGLADKIRNCTECKLSGGRKNVVFGEGNAEADLMFIGEGPGREEDVQARPFVGDAGKLLTNLIVKLGLKREDVYIANIVKCRPPNNRNPEKDEIASCVPFLKKQIEKIKPKVIVCLGKVSAQALLNSKVPISKMRGSFFEYNNVPVMPTFHPAYLLRNPKDKWLTWDDMQKVLEKLKKQ